MTNYILVGGSKKISILFHLTEDSIWDNRILTEKLHMSNFKIAMAIILDHFSLKNGIFFISHRYTTQENDFFICKLTLDQLTQVQHLLFD